MKKFIFALAILISTNAYACRTCIRELCLNLQMLECDWVREKGDLDTFDKGYLYGYRAAIATMHNCHPEISLTVYEYEAIFKNDRKDGDRE